MMHGMERRDWSAQQLISSYNGVFKDTNKMIQQRITNCVDLELCDVSLPVEDKEVRGKKESIVNAMAHRG